MNPQIVRLQDGAALYEAGADAFVRAARLAVADRGVFSVALAGGSTPRGLYARLAGDPRFRARVPWDRIECFWGDERHVPPDHPDSNYGMAHEALLTKVPVAEARVHRVPAERPDAHEVAEAYEADVQSIAGPGGGVPRLDLVLLGIGADGHTASLFPGTAALNERSRLVVANWVEKLDAFRITMTLPLLNAAREVIFLVTGAEKAEAVRDILRPGPDTTATPASLIQPADGSVMWLLDRAAARPPAGVIRTSIVTNR